MKYLSLLVMSFALFAAEPNDYAPPPISADMEAHLARVVGYLKAMPEPRIPAPVKARPLPELSPIIKGALAIKKGEMVVMDAVTLISSGPENGLELVACLTGGKQHESFCRTIADNGIAINLAMIGALDLSDGQVPALGGGLPARGIPLEVTVQWVPDPLIDPSRKEAHLSTFIRDRTTDRILPPLPFIYTGSYFHVGQVPTAKGLEERPMFMLDASRSLIVTWDVPDALLASPLPHAVIDKMWEVNGRQAPPVSTVMQLVFRRAVLPLTLSMDAQGALSCEGKILNDAALSALLGKTFTKETDLAAFAVSVQITTAREKDLEVRERCLKAARDAKVWAVPVFFLQSK